MRIPTALIASSIGILLLGSAAPASWSPPAATTVDIGRQMAAAAVHAAAMAPAPPVAPALPEPPPPPPPPPTAQEALADGVLIVVSLASQRMFVFRDGELWDSSRVSTGKRGHETPVGEFPILQKKVHHRSNLYNDAPMPFMQRLTWDGVALHAGRVPGYAASHGCIRMPRAFAQKLYGITGFSSTVVVVTEEEVESATAARTMV